MKTILIILSFLSFTLTSNAVNVQDSIRIESLLASVQYLREDYNPMMFFGENFIGTPYVAHTLDLDKEERLVINTRELDCTTFVENVVALSLCAKKGYKTFGEFKDLLRQVRYKSGRVDYVYRNHYFTSWMENNAANGFVELIESDKAPFISVQKLDIDYMTQHYTSYAMLKAHPEWLKDIRQTEKELTGRTYRYIPKGSISGSKLMRETIKSGDIIAILTNKKGLDTSHIGIASWHSDGLHLLNASQIHKKVIDEPMLLRTYMSKHPSQIGIRLARVLYAK